MISELWRLIAELMIEVLKGHVVPERRIAGGERRRSATELIVLRLRMAVVLAIEMLISTKLWRLVKRCVERRSGLLLRQLLRLLTVEVLFCVILIRLAGARPVHVAAAYAVTDHRACRCLGLHRFESCLTQVLQLEVVLIITHRAVAVVSASSLIDENGKAAGKGLEIVMVCEIAHGF